MSVLGSYFFTWKNYDPNKTILGVGAVKDLSSVQRPQGSIHSIGNIRQKTKQNKKQLLYLDSVALVVLTPRRLRQKDHKFEDSPGNLGCARLDKCGLP